MKKFFFVFLVSINLCCYNAFAVSYDTAILQGLDKVTARVLTIEAHLGDTKKIGSLEIIVRACDKRPPEETPESAAFVDVWEVSFPPPQEKIAMLNSVEKNIICLFIFLFVFERLIIEPRKLVFESEN